MDFRPSPTYMPFLQATAKSPEVRFALPFPQSPFWLGYSFAVSQGGEEEMNLSSVEIGVGSLLLVVLAIEIVFFYLSGKYR